MGCAIQEIITDNQPTKSNPNKMDTKNPPHQHHNQLSKTSTIIIGVGCDNNKMTTTGTTETTLSSLVMTNQKSQQLKEQHSALVKLLESAPIKTTTTTTKSSTSSSSSSSKTSNNYSSINNLSNNQSTTTSPNAHCEHLKNVNSQHPQNVSSHHRKRLKSIHQQNSVQNAMLPPNEFSNMNLNSNSNSNSKSNSNTNNLLQNINSIRVHKSDVSNIESYCQNQINPHPSTSSREFSSSSSSSSSSSPQSSLLSSLSSSSSSLSSVIGGVLGMDDDIMDEDECGGIDSDSGNNQKSSSSLTDHNNYETYQCPWKKIRYAREWKQRKQQQQQQQQQQNHQQQHQQQQSQQQGNIELKDSLASDEKIAISSLERQNSELAKRLGIIPENSTVPPPPSSISTSSLSTSTTSSTSSSSHNRRDSSDSNSSLSSTSSLQSTASSTSSSVLSSCTCTPQQLELDQDTTPCQCNNCQSMDMDSGCDDEALCEQTLTMNYLCQKFDENLSSNSKSSDKIVQIEIKTESTTNATMTAQNLASGTSDGFFRRSIQQKIQYRPCTKNQQCSILRINRNRCQYCRLKKCIAVGMSRDAVRFGRVPKREKARILAAMQQSTQNRSQHRALATELDDQPRLLAAVLRAHLETCEFTKEKVAAMRQRARECPSYSMPTLLACPLNPAPELQSEQEFSQRFAHVIRGVIDFAGMIPGFQLLTQDDKFTLLKAGLFDALFVRLICMFDSSINSIICLNGQVMRRDAIQNGANARFLVDSTFNFAERMNSMNLSDAEIGLFCAIVLITPDRPGLRNIELIEKMYSRLKACLQTIINQNRPDQPEFMAKLLETMPDLRTLSTLHTEKLVVFRTEHKELLRQQMWSMEDEQPSKSPASSWDDARMDDVAKSPLGSVSSTESGDLEYSSQSSLASSAPLLAATLSGTCPLRNRANSGSSGEDIDIVGPHAHLTQNGLTITPIIRSHSHNQLHHHLTAGATHHHRYRKLDSPTDSGIESGNEKNESTKNVSSGGSSSCSSPRSSVDDALDAEAAAQSLSATAAAATSSSTIVASSASPSTAMASSSSSSTSPSCTSSAAMKRQIVEDMPVLKRVLQAPPLYDTNSLMDEAYKPHKKFRALRHREFDTAEADATSTPASTTSATIPATTSPAPSSALPAPVRQHQQSPPPASSSTASPSPHHHSLPPHQHQSQLHMHLTRNTSTTNGSSSRDSSASSANYQQHSSLSSTHSVLAKSLMAEPRMTPEQMKRSDIIQNYIMRDQSAATSNGLLVCAANSPAPQHHYASSGSPSSSSNSNCSSPSTTTVTLASPPPSSSAASSSTLHPPAAVTPNGMRWQGHSVITTTTIRQQSVSPNSNGSSSNGGSSNYFQSPHSTSVSPPRPSPSAHSPRLLELQVDIADSQQPLNLSKKSPTPPPSKIQALVTHKYPTMSADVTVTATTTASPQPPTPQVHKVLLEA